MEKKFESKLHYIEEMIDSIQESIDNVEKVTEEQNLLLQIIKDSDKADKFEKFIKDTEKQLEAFGVQKEKLEKKIEMATEIVEKSKSDSEIDFYLTMLMNLFGMFEKIDD